MPDIVLQTRDLVRVFGGGRTLFMGKKPSVYAVRGVDIAVRKGETLGIVGESGCGKSTLARMLVGLDRPSDGDIQLSGAQLNDLLSQDRHALSRRIQYVFQDPISSLNPRKLIRETLSAPLRYLRNLSGKALEDRLKELMDCVNLRPEFLDRYPHEFSGGQAQRIGIARALAAEPEIIVLDEPVSALDVSVQAQVLNLLDDLKARFGLTYIFISHDLSVVEAVSDRVAVMYFGRVVEQAAGKALFVEPRHPYTRLLLDSAPVPGKRGLQGEEANAELPDPMAPPPGCAFAPRCPYAQDDCRKKIPDADFGLDNHAAACFHPLGRMA
ncbi:peptide ABC transporter ATP-binding protein [Thalassospira profundimaris]|uniref:Peptide ABC transporter ATP-binding protein n=1 Tax=Thalassospira profundimaris TaxID=502049 RepID=A0A367WYI0_9PROT|nr:oligopeptide/dipeptide ABC transporter ATP-binding protein [Thalassospira profundimaris]RCK46505.1 peptide ABC transporter ATP-binding protein [Thalassospira profundimaris]